MGAMELTQRNHYAGPCHRCGGPVAAGAGQVEGVPGAHLLDLIRHEDGKCSPAEIAAGQVGSAMGTVTYEAIRAGGGVEATVDRAHRLEVEARRDAERQQARGRRWCRCRKCGVTGWTRDYPFSTNPGSGYCDDCGD